MFYAHFVLAKKGPLARIWLAAHWDKKLTKAHVYETNIEKSVDGILQPKVKMALRTTGHLLLGIVRIYSRKAKYLLADCNEAFVKIKMAFRPGMVDLPEENREAAVNAITLPEVFHDFDTVMPQLDDLSLKAQLSISQVMRVDEITLREEYGTINMDFENGFGEMPGLAQEQEEEDLSVIRDSFANDQLREENLLFQNEASSSRPNTRGSKSMRQAEQTARSEEPSAMEIGGSGGGLFDDLGDFNQTANEGQKAALQSPSLEETDPGNNAFDPPSPGGLSSLGGGDLSRPDTPFEDMMPPPSVEESFDPMPGPSGMTSLRSMNRLAGSMSEHTTLLHNEEESFALEPVDASAIRGQIRPKRKRKLIVDDVKAISGDDMKSQLSDTFDILMALDLAPPTKKLMFMKEIGATEKLLSLPGRYIYSQTLSKHFDVNSLQPLHDGNEFFGLLGDSERDGFVLDHVPGYDAETPAKRGRKRQAEDQPPKKQAPKAAANKENMPPPYATPMATPAYMQTPDHMGTPAYMQTPGHMPTPVYMTTPAHMATPAHMGTPAYMPNPGLPMGTPSYMTTPSHIPSNSFDNFDNFDLGGADVNWDAPLSDVPIASSSAFNQDQTSFAADQPANPPENVFNHQSEEVKNLEDEEMQEGETVEAFEDRVLNKRAAHLNTILKTTLTQNSDKLPFSRIATGNIRKQVAQKFYSILVLQKALAVDVQQDGDNGEIFISKGAKFETAVF